MAPAAIGFVEFGSNDQNFYMQCLLGDGTGNPTGGYGGWSIKTRPRRRGFTIWDGNEPLQIDIPILINHEDRDGVSGERDCRQLESMAGANKGFTMREPPLIWFDSGGVVSHDLTDNPNQDWVITNIQWGDCEKTTYGNRWRQAATVTVMQFVEDDALKNVSAAQRRKGNKTAAKRGSRLKGAKHKIHTVKKGETLGKIAKTELGSAKRWHEIAQLNGIRDPQKLKVGEKLRLP